MRKTEYPKDTKTLGRKIRKKRMDLDWSLDDLAKKVDVTASYLSRIESDKKIPNPKVAEAIAIALNENPSVYTSHSMDKFLPQKIGIVNQLSQIVSELRTLYPKSSSNQKKQIEKLALELADFITQINK